MGKKRIVNVTKTARYLTIQHKAAAFKENDESWYSRAYRAYLPRQRYVALRISRKKIFRKEKKKVVLWLNLY